MNDTITFAIPGKPVGKGRPRATTIGGHARMYTPKKTESYESLVRMAFYNEHRARNPIPAGIPLRLTIWCWFAIPKSWSKKRQAQAMHHTGKPDADNILKVVGDALNGVAWHDDSQVSTAVVFKRYATDGERESVMVEIMPMNDLCD